MRKIVYFSLSLFLKQYFVVLNKICLYLNKIYLYIIEKVLENILRVCCNSLWDYCIHDRCMQPSLRFFSNNKSLKQHNFAVWSSFHMRVRFALTVGATNCNFKYVSLFVILCVFPTQQLSSFSHFLYSFFVLSLARWWSETWLCAVLQASAHFT